jgi:hypothetical protein
MPDAFAHTAHTSCVGIEHNQLTVLDPFYSRRVRYSERLIDLRLIVELLPNDGLLGRVARGAALPLTNAGTI